MPEACAAAVSWCAAVGRSKLAPVTQPETAPATGTLPRLRLYYEKNEHRIAVGAFVAGFVFDILTLGRIDSWAMIGQQAAYLGLILFALTQMLLEQDRPDPGLATMSAPARWYRRYRTFLVHFLFGSLLNLYTIFFFKSSSLLVSFSFLAVLVLIMVANELQRFKALGLAFKFLLLALCILSFSALVVPVLVGSISLAVFLVSMAVGCLPMAAVASRLRRRSPELALRARRQVLLPLGVVLLVFLTFYLFRLIPPVPLSIPFIGVYHAVEKTEDGYALSHERAWWRFWQNGDQQFRAQPGDRIVVFFRVFSPTRFSDQVLMRWYHREARGWAPQDSIPINIVGGREDGFRGYGVKTNYQPGDWKVQVETTDGREIGRIYFDVETVAEGQRNFELYVD
jgi:hypothetical protein